MPWFDRSCRKNSSFRTATEDEHLTSSSDVPMRLFDRFHEGNVKKETEILQRLTLIKELRASSNSQVIEQLHFSTKYSVRP